MAIKTSIIGTDCNTSVKVSSRGQLAVAPLDFSTSYTGSATVNNVAVDIVPPIAGKCFVITDIFLDAGKGVSASTAATVDLYEATDPEEETIDKAILSFEMLKNTNRVITGLNLIVNAGRWVNLKTTDNTVSISVLGYYVNLL